MSCRWLEFSKTDRLQIWEQTDRADDAGDYFSFSPPSLVWTRCNCYPDRFGKKNSQRLRNSVGAVVWDAALVLAHYLHLEASAQGGENESTRLCRHIRHARCLLLPGVRRMSESIQPPFPLYWGRRWKAAALGRPQSL